MQALGTYFHQKGIQYGLYTAESNNTCGGYPGSAYNEKLDAATFAEWGVDYMKVLVGASKDLIWICFVYLFPLRLCIPHAYFSLIRCRCTAELTLCPRRRLNQHPSPPFVTGGRLRTTDEVLRRGLSGNGQCTGGMWAPHCVSFLSPSSALPFSIH